MLYFYIYIPYIDSNSSTYELLFLYPTLNPMQISWKPPKISFPRLPKFPPAQCPGSPWGPRPVDCATRGHTCSDMQRQKNGYNAPPPSDVNVG